MFMHFGRDWNGFYEIRRDGFRVNVSFSERTKRRFLVTLVPVAALITLSLILHLRDDTVGTLFLITGGNVLVVRGLAAIVNAVWGLASNRSYYKTCSILLALACIYPIMGIQEDMSSHTDMFDGLGAFFGGIILGILAVFLLLYGFLWFRTARRDR